MSAPRSQRPPQPPLLPPPARKTIPQPPPPPRSRTSIAADCSTDAFSHPPAGGAKVVIPLRNGIDNCSFSAPRLSTSFAGRGLIPLPPPSISFKTNTSAPPPPPPENPAEVNLKQSQHLRPQPPLVLPLEPPRVSAVAQSPTQHDPTRNRSTVLVLPPPCCPHQSRTRLRLQRGRFRAHKQTVFDGEEAGLSKSHLAECECSRILNPESGSSALPAESLQQKSKCDAPRENLNSTGNEMCSTTGERQQEAPLEQRVGSGRDLGYIAQANSGAIISPSSPTGNSLTSDRPRRTGPGLLHFYRTEDSHASQPTSPAWKGERYRPCTHVLHKKTTKEEYCELVLPQSPSEVVSHRRTTQAQLVGTILEHRHRRLASFRNVSACNSREVEAPQIPPPPTSSPETRDSRTGKQSTFSSCLRDGESVSSHAPVSLSRGACSAWNTVKKEEQSSLALGTVHCGQRAHPHSAAQAGAPAEDACSISRCSKPSCLSGQWPGKFLVKTCPSGASSSSSGSSSSTHVDYEYGAGDWRGVLPRPQGTADIQTDTEEIPVGRTDNTNERDSTLFVSVHSFSNDDGEAQQRAKDCSEKTSRCTRFDDNGARRCSLRSLQTLCGRTVQRSSDAAHCVQSDVDAAEITHGAMFVGCPSSGSAVQASTVQNGVSSFALATRTRTGFRQITVLSPPTEAAGVNKGRVSEWASASQLAMVGESPSYRAGEGDICVKAKNCSSKTRCSPSENVPWLQRTAAPFATPQKLSSPGRYFRPSPCTATLSHLPPSPLTPLALTDNSAGNMLPSSLLAGELQKNHDASHKQGGYPRSDWTHGTKTKNSQGQPEYKLLYCEQSFASSTAPPSHAQSPRYAGTGPRRYRRRKQNKVRRRVKGKLRREEALGDRRLLYAHAVPPQLADEEEASVNNPVRVNARTGIEQRGSAHAAADECSCKPLSRSSHTTTVCDFDRCTTDDPSSMPDCEAWASSPAVVARHIKSRRLTRIDNEWCTDFLHNAQRRRDCGAPLQPDADEDSRRNTANLYACSGLRDQDHQMQAKCNSLFMPSSRPSWPFKDCEGVTPQRGVLYTFELPNWKESACRRHTSGPELLSQVNVEAQQQKIQALPNKETRVQARLRAAATSKAKQTSGQAAASVLPLPTRLSLSSRGCSTSSRPPSPLCRSQQGRHLAQRTSVRGDLEDMRPLSADSRNRGADWCCKEGTSTCSSRSGASSGPVESRCQALRNSCDFLECCRPPVGIEHHTEVYKGHMKDNPRDIEMRSRSASGCCSDSTYCDSTPSTRDASSKMLPEEVEALGSSVLCDKQRSSPIDLNANGDVTGRCVKKTFSGRWGGAQETQVCQGANATTQSLHAVNDRGTSSIDFSRTGTCRSVDRCTSDINPSDTCSRDCRLIVVCQSEDATAHRRNELPLSGRAMATRDYEKNRLHQSPTGWADTFCLRGVMLNTDVSG